MNARGTCTVMVRATIQKRVNLNSGVYIYPKQWDAQRQRVRGTTELVQALNDQLTAYRVRLLRANEVPVRGQALFILKDTVREYGDASGEEVGLVAAFKAHNERLRLRLGGWARSIFEKYEHSRRILEGGCGLSAKWRMCWCGCSTRNSSTTLSLPAGDARVWEQQRSKKIAANQNGAADVRAQRLSGGASASATTK